MKGLNALEIIFTLFVLIVVVLVVVRMFITRFTFTGIEAPIRDITETYNYQAAYSTCENLCNRYEADCGNTQNAVKFCLQKANIDIDGDKIPGEGGKYHYNVVQGVPMCEDGIYCFHVKTDCACGDFRLTPKTCLSVLCDYYEKTLGYSEDVTAQMISRGIKYGSCEPNIRYWEVEGYTPVYLKDEEYTSDWTDDEISYMGPDHWWAKAGYLTPCGISLKIIFDCERDDTDKIRCEWGGITTDAGITVCITPDCKPPGTALLDHHPIDPDEDSWTFGPYDTGETYYLILSVEGGFEKTVIVDL